MSSHVPRPEIRPCDAVPSFQPHDSMAASSTQSWDPPWSAVDLWFTRKASANCGCNWRIKTSASVYLHSICCKSCRSPRLGALKTSETVGAILDEPVDPSNCLQLVCCKVLSLWSLNLLRTHVVDFGSTNQRPYLWRLAKSGDAGTIKTGAQNAKSMRKKPSLDQLANGPHQFLPSQLRCLKSLPQIKVAGNFQSGLPFDKNWRWKSNQN